MSNTESAKPPYALAEHLARKGPDELEMLEAAVDLARQLLASGEVQPYAEGENLYEIPPYPWEVTEPPSNAPRRIYLGAVSDLATGQGHTVYFAAGLARDEDEFRRQMVAHIGYTFANGAEVKLGIGDFPFTRTFISPSLRQILEKFDEGKDAPCSLFFLSRWHENPS